MKQILLSSSAALALVACAQPQSTVLPPYQLADGRVYQDVVSIGSNGAATAPVVTVVNTYALVEGPKGGAAGDCGCTTRPVSSASGAQPGLLNALIAAVGPGIVAGVVADVLSDDELSSSSAAAGSTAEPTTQTTPNI